MPSLLFCKILDPNAASYHEITRDTFNDLYTLAKCVEGQNGNGSISAEQKCHGHQHKPCKSAVKQECNSCFATGAQGEIGSVDIGVEGNENARNKD